MRDAAPEVELRERRAGVARLLLGLQQRLHRAVGVEVIELRLGALQQRGAIVGEGSGGDAQQHGTTAERLHAVPGSVPAPGAEKRDEVPTPGKLTHRSAHPTLTLR